MLLSLFYFLFILLSFGFIISLLFLLGSRYLVNILLKIRITIRTAITRIAIEGGFRYCFFNIMWDTYNILWVLYIFLLLLICVVVFCPQILHFDDLDLQFFITLFSIIHHIYGLVFLLSVHLLFLVAKTWRKSLDFYNAELFFVVLAIFFSFEILSLKFDRVFFIAFAMGTLKRVCF